MSIQSEAEYEDVLAQWSDLELGLGVILGSPANAQQFALRVVQYDRWMQELLQRDQDVGLYLLFHLASNSPVGYSASHALVCAVLCHLLALEWQLLSSARNSLVRAALTMNIGMTTLQDALANQVEKPTPEQQEAIRTHAVKGATLLTSLGIADDEWLDIVANHHNEALDREEGPVAPTLAHLARTLRMVDRYAAMISPRVSRAGRSASESARSLMAGGKAKTDDIAQALIRIVGLYPPGTYVRLDSDELGVVLRRSQQLNLPYVAIIAQSSGEMLALPRLHGTASGKPEIRSALPAAVVQARLNHFHMLQLSTFAGLEAG